MIHTPHFPQSFLCVVLSNWGTPKRSHIVMNIFVCTFVQYTSCHLSVVKALGRFDHSKEIHVPCISVERIVHNIRCHVIAVCLVQHSHGSVMASCLLDFIFNRLQSTSNVALNVNVQEVLPAIQTSSLVGNI